MRLLPHEEKNADIYHPKIPSVMRPSTPVLPPGVASFLSAALALAAGAAGFAAVEAPELKSEEAALKGELVAAAGLKAIEGSLMTDRGRPKAG